CSALVSHAKLFSSCSVFVTASDSFWEPARRCSISFLVSAQAALAAARQARAAYNCPVARGWESKSVEEQQAEALSEARQNKPRPTPEQLGLQRKRQAILLSR